MTTGDQQGPGEAEPVRPGATEPITLTDPDGAVTRVAPWSTWTREQVRAPGGEPALVTRLEQGQLWFAAGRRRSPWRHEVLVGPATVSTPRGRFHVTAEADGGATIACLSGRTRVTAGLGEPVVLGPDQSASVASDGATIVVMDRTSADPVPDPEPETVDEAEVVVLPATDEPTDEPDIEPAPAHAPSGPTDYAAPLPLEALPARRASDRRLADAVEPPPSALPTLSAPPFERSPRIRWAWLPELVAVAALLGVLVAAALVFGSGSDGAEVAAPPATVAVTTTDVEPSTTDAPTTTVAPTTSTEPVPSTTTSPPSVTAPATAAGRLVACKRVDGGVQATIAVEHRSGGRSPFVVRVGLVDGAGTVFAQGQAQSPAIDPGATAPVDVKVPVAGSVSGACELLGVEQP